MTPTADQLVTALDLKPHPEGGFFREVHRSPHEVQLADGRRRSACTGIYFLLGAGQFSAWHVVASDETWHLYAGGPLALHLLDAPPAGRPQADVRLTTVVLGADVAAGQQPQAVVPAGVLQAAQCPEDVPFVLCGCTVAPGFDWADFAMPSRASLLARFPEHADLVVALTRV